jgi:hypothetical protein
MDAREAIRAAARERKRAQREREKKKLAPRTRLSFASQPDRDDDPSDPESDQLSPAGLVAAAQTMPALPPALHVGDEFSGDLMQEQARWVYERRLLTIIERRRRLGELIPVDEARAQSAALARRIRAALDRAPSHLPADLTPELRAACTAALGLAIKQAMAAL